MLSHAKCGYFRKGYCAALVWQDGLMEGCRFSFNDWTCPVDFLVKRIRAGGEAAWEPEEEAGDE